MLKTSLTGQQQPGHSTALVGNNNRKMSALVYYSAFKKQASKKDQLKAKKPRRINNDC